ncbi:hypothetical protein PYV61_18365, partial [Roseisolibacter sp. H3M3-2]
AVVAADATPAAAARALARLPADAGVQPGARATVTPAGQLLEAAADEAGAFRFCHLPAGARAALVVVHEGRAAEPVEVALPAAGTVLQVLAPPAP